MSNPQQATGEHLLLIRGTDWARELSPADLQRVMTDFYGWVEDLQTRGLLKAAQPLMEEGKIVSGPRGSRVTDGMFAEAKESIAGYFLLAVDSMDEALSLARACPILDQGAQVEVRPIANLCRPMAQVRENHAVGTA